MEEQLITFETAKLANKKGFAGWTNKRYNRKGTFNESKNWSISAPTQSLLQKWLRDTHGIHVKIDDWELEKWYYYIRRLRINHTNVETIRTHNEKWEFKTYEEVLEAGLQEALNLI